MREKIKLSVASAVFVVGAFLLQASAQGVSVYSVQNYNYGSGGYLNYMMGAVNINGNPVITPTQPVPVVLPQSCQPVMTSFHKIGSQDAEVTQLQNFLNEYNGANLNGQGFYGPVTEREVKNLQYAYGLPVTGMQFEKTTGLINSIKCGTVAKRDRVVYMSVAGSNTSYVSTAEVSNGSVVKNVYPNAPTTSSNGVVRNYPTKTPGGVMTGMPGTSTVTSMDDGTSTSFFANLTKDWQKIKDNYKAYALVFLLVLALFWFLRKAATE